MFKSKNLKLGCSVFLIILSIGLTFAELKMPLAKAAATPSADEQQQKINNMVNDITKNNASGPTEQQINRGVAPDLYQFKSRLLPGSKQADYQKYFIDTILPRTGRILLSGSAIMAVIMIIYAGYKLIFQLGNEESITSAKNIIQWAVIGLILGMFSYFIVSLINSLGSIKT